VYLFDHACKPLLAILDETIGDRSGILENICRTDQKIKCDNAKVVASVNKVSGTAEISS